MYLLAGQVYSCNIHAIKQDSGFVVWIDGMDIMWCHVSRPRVDPVRQALGV